MRTRTGTCFALLAAVGLACSAAEVPELPGDDPGVETVADADVHGDPGDAGDTTQPDPAGDQVGDPVAADDGAADEAVADASPEPGPDVSCGPDGGIVTYTCPGGADVPWCACTTLGVRCVEHPEYRCPGLCDPDALTTWTCPGGTQVKWCSCAAPACTPECRNAGTPEEGWYDSCSGGKIKVEPCAGCGVACGAIGSKSEGWGSSCSGLIAWAQCAPTRDCVKSPEALCPSLDCTTETATYECPNGVAVPFCHCQPACPPSCGGIGTPQEGWYDCAGAFLKADACKGCWAVCDLVGSKSEGWYSKCTTGTGVGLIGWDKCSQGTWTCDAAPWDQCTQPLPCTPLGRGYLDPGNATWGWCCPGLEPIDPDFLDNDSCVFPELPGKVCSLCGDGQCSLPENPCNCASDCAEEPPPVGPGQACNAGWDCGSGLQCASMNGNFPLGTCTTVCDPLNADETPCPEPGMACLPLPEHQAPGFCMKPCKTDADCPPLTTCGGHAPGSLLAAATGGCFAWGPCDPILDAWCGPAAPQCRVKGGLPACGAAGALKLSDTCDKADDRCGPGLVCGSISRCWPACAHDDQCRQQQYDFCLKPAKDVPYGHCMILE
jgi:hypothetical protein